MWALKDEGKKVQVFEQYTTLASSFNVRPWYLVPVFKDLILPGLEKDEQWQFVEQMHKARKEAQHGDKTVQQQQAG